MHISFCLVTLSHGRSSGSRASVAAVPHMTRNKTSCAHVLSDACFVEQNLVRAFSSATNEPQPGDCCTSSQHFRAAHVFGDKTCTSPPFSLPFTTHKLQVIQALFPICCKFKGGKHGTRTHEHNDVASLMRFRQVQALLNCCTNFVLFAWCGHEKTTCRRLTITACVHAHVSTTRRLGTRITVCNDGWSYTQQVTVYVSGCLCLWICTWSTQRREINSALEGALARAWS